MEQNMESCDRVCHREKLQVVTIIVMLTRHLSHYFLLVILSYDDRFHWLSPLSISRSDCSGFFDFGCHIQYICISWVLLFGLLLTTFPTGNLTLCLMKLPHIFSLQQKQNLPMWYCRVTSSSAPVASTSKGILRPHLWLVGRSLSRQRSGG